MKTEQQRLPRFAVLIDADSPIAVLGVFGLILFHLVLGWRLYGLSKPAAAGAGALASG